MVANSRRPAPRLSGALTRTSTTLTVFLLAANLALVGWWTWFQMQQTSAIEAAGRELERGDGEGAARALGASSVENLDDLARSQRRMFLSEGITFLVVLGLAGAAVLVTLHRQARLRADQDRFLAGATHELKTPIATIQLLLESLRDGRLPADKHDRYLRSGLLEAHRLEAGVNNLLTAAGVRGSVARHALRAPGDLADDVRAAVARLQARAEAAGVQVQTGDLPSLYVQRDPEALQLVMHNLIDNAIKHSPQGSTVRIGMDVDQRHAVLTVDDQGRGMDAEVLANAFVPFWRGRDSATGGTGLGLYLVRELVEDHGGSVTADSPGPGRGSRLTVRLPLLRSNGEGRA